MLDAAIDRHHVETMIGRAGEPTLAAAHALDHVAAHGRLLQAAQGLLLRHRRIDDDHPLGTLVTNNARQHTGIDPPDAGYAVLLAYFAKGLGIAEITRQVVVFAHDHTADSRILGFVILVRNAVVADQRIGHHDHLVGIGGIGENLLVADHRGIEHDLARRLPVRAETVAVELAARLKHDFFGEWFHIRLFRNLSSFIFQFPALFPASGRIRDDRSHRPSKNGIAFRIPIRDNPRTSLPPRLSETLRRVCRTSSDQRPERTARNPPAGKRRSAAFRQEGFGIDLVLRIEVEHR